MTLWLAFRARLSGQLSHAASLTPAGERCCRDMRPAPKAAACLMLMSCWGSKQRRPAASSSVSIAVCVLRRAGTNGRNLDAKKKRPMHMCARATPFALAGVYDVWKGDGGKAITSFAIVTTDAAPSVAQYHNRMPVVLDDSQFDDWMRDTPDQAAALMKPYAGAIEAWEVGAEVGNVRNNRPELMERVGLF